MALRLIPWPYRATLPPEVESWCEEVAAVIREIVEGREQ